MRIAEGRDDLPLGSVDTLPGLAHRLGVGSRALAQLRGRRSDFPIPAADIGGSILYDVHEFVAWYEEFVGS
jgi:hypothetical protein